MRSYVLNLKLMPQWIQVIQLTITGKKAKAYIYPLLSLRWRSNFCLKPANEHPEIISSSKIFQITLTTCILIVRPTYATRYFTLCCCTARVFSTEVRPHHTAAPGPSLVTHATGSVLKLQAIFMICNLSLSMLPVKAKFYCAIQVADLVADL